MKYKKEDIGFNGKHFIYGSGIYQELKKDFFDVDVDDVIQKLERWLLSHPPKKDWRRFLCNNLNRAKKKFGVKPGDEPKYERRGDGQSQPKKVDFDFFLNQLPKGVSDGRTEEK